MTQSRSKKKSHPKGWASDCGYVGNAKEYVGNASGGSSPFMQSSGRIIAHWSGRHSTTLTAQSLTPNTGTTK